MRLRQHLGLRHDRDHVEATEASFSASIPESPAGQLSIRFTPEEAAVVDERFDLQDHVPIVDDAALQSSPARYSGAFLTSNTATSRPELYLAFTAVSEREKNELRSLLPTDFQDRLFFDETAVYPLQELLRKREAIELQLTMRGFVFGGSGIDEAANRIVIYSDDSRVREFATNNYSDLALVASGGYSVPTINKNDPLPYALVIGGQAIGPTQGANDPLCTSGFAVQSAYGPFILSAGHCADQLGEEWFQGGSSMGIVSAVWNVTNSDAMLIGTIGLRNQTGRVHTQFHLDYDPVHFMTPGDARGFIVCQTGMTTTGLSGYLNINARCGTILDRFFDPGPVHTATFRLADMVGNPGDSGASVYRDTIYGRSAEGVVSGCLSDVPDDCSNNPPRTYYSYLPNIAARWGLQLSPP